jgi:hypothetical protein
MQQSSNTTNIVIYGTNESDAKSIAHVVIGETQEKGVFVSQHEGQQLRGFIRFIGGSSYTIPQGITDIIIVHVESASDESFPVLSQYLSDRATVPVRVILSSDSGVNTFASESGVLVCNDQSGLRNLILSKLKEFRDTLQNLFNKHAQAEGLNKSGLDALLAEHSAGTESETSYLFSHNENLSFHAFYTWFVMGRNDAYYYKGIVDMQRLGPEIASMLTKNFEKLKDVAGSEYHGKLDIAPTTDFGYGIKVGLETNFGDNYTAISQGFSHSQLASPFTASFEIGVVDPSKVPEMVQKLNMLKEMGKELAVVFKYLLRSGLDIQFRNVGNRFFIDCVISGLFGEMVHNAIPSNINLNNLHFSAGTTLSFSSGFSPMSVLAKPLEEIIKNALSISIQGTGNFLNVGTINSIISFVFRLLKVSEKEQKMIDLGLAAFNVLKSLGFEFKYDTLDLFQSVSEVIASQTGAQPTSDPIGNLQILSQMFAQQQQMLGMFVLQGKQMVPFIEEYMGVIKNIQFDNISASISSSILKAHAKVYLEIPGLTDFVNQTFL